MARLYGKAAWRRRRADQLQAEPLCAACLKERRVTAATVADHIERATDERSFWEGALQSLCARHHNAKRQAESRSGQQGEHRPDWLPKPTCRVMLVCGPPGSGKSTYVAERATPADTIIDLDEIKAQMANAPLYHADKRWLGPALAQRNRQLADLSKAPVTHTAWVILSAPSKPLRKWWSDTLRAENTAVLDVPADECKRRIKADERRRPVMVEHLSAVDDWWAREKGHKAIPLKRGADVHGMPIDPLHPWNQRVLTW